MLKFNVLFRGTQLFRHRPSIGKSDGIETGAWRYHVPLGGGVGKIFYLGKLPVTTQISAYYNVVRPNFGPNGQIRAQVQFLFPK